MSETLLRDGDKEFQYGGWWMCALPQIKRHKNCIQYGGRWKKKNGEWAGEGLFFHYKGFIKGLWPHFAQNRWFDLILKSWLENDLIGLAGCKDSGKSASLSVIHLADYYCFPHTTIVVLSSTTKESLENRLFAETVMRHKEARMAHDWIPGHLIQGRLRIVTDGRDSIEAGRDCRKGFVGIPVKKGSVKDAYDLIVGIKNLRKRWVLEELQTLPSAALDGMANFFQTGSETKVSGTGNPSDTMDAHGKLCEPHSSIGGWESKIDSHGKTKTWRTHLNGICVHLPGSDSPNMDVGPNEPVPFPFLMTREQMDKDAMRWTRTDWHFQMFNEGRWPRGEGASRVITRQLCINGGALKQAKWSNNIRTKLLAMDAGFGGDRCVCHEMWFGDELQEGETNPERRQIIAIMNTFVVPITGDDVKEAEDQIVIWMKNRAELCGIPASHCFVEPGMRVGLVSKFSTLWSDKVNMIDFGGKPSETMVSHEIQQSCREFYFNFNTELWYSARLIIECGQLRQMDEETMQEGIMREYQKNAGGNKIKIETKAEYKEKTGFSPDRFDALVTGMEGAKRLGFIIKRNVAAPSEDDEDYGWKQKIENQADEFWNAGMLITNS